MLVVGFHGKAKVGVGPSAHSCRAAACTAARAWWKTRAGTVQPGREDNAQAARGPIDLHLLDNNPACVEELLDNRQPFRSATQPATV